MNRYIKDEELGSRLNLQPRQVRAALAELKEQGFAAQESMTDEIYSGRSSNYWYVDLRHAVNVIRLRVCEMQKILSQRQQAKTAQQVGAVPCRAAMDVKTCRRPLVESAACDNTKSVFDLLVVWCCDMVLRNEQ